MSSHLENAVGVYFEGDFNLRSSPWCRWDASQLELAQLVVVLGEGSLALEDRDGDRTLVVLVGGEHLRFSGRDNGSTIHQFGHHISDGLDTERQGSRVDNQDLLLHVLA